MGLRNRDVKSVELNINETNTQHTNPDGSVVDIKVITDDMYFNKRVKSKPLGCSWLFPNHIEYNGWLSLNGFVKVDIEELPDRHH